MGYRVSKRRSDGDWRVAECTNVVLENSINILFVAICYCFTNTAFTLSGFDDQERNPMFVKTAFQVKKLKFLACSMKQAFYPLHKQNIART